MRHAGSGFVSDAKILLTREPQLIDILESGKKGRDSETGGTKPPNQVIKAVVTNMKQIRRKKRYSDS
jgi:hypothetical protein